MKAIPMLSIATLFFFFFFFLSESAEAQLSETFYSKSCPRVSEIVRDEVKKAMDADKRMPASLIRLHFHDCAVKGCDGSILLDDQVKNGKNISSEKSALPNLNSARGFEVVDKIKSALEAACPGVVSCADILALVSEAAVNVAGGPSWNVKLGRYDSKDAYKAEADGLRTVFSSLTIIAQKFQEIGLNTTDLVALSGAHTFGRGQCRVFINRLYNFNNTGKADPDMDPAFLADLKKKCPNVTGALTNLNNLDTVTPNTFDNMYFKNLMNKKGLLATDQGLFSSLVPGTAEVVEKFALDQQLFFNTFGESMIKMGNFGVLLNRTEGDIRKNCRFVN